MDREIIVGRYISLSLCARHEVVAVADPPEIYCNIRSGIIEMKKKCYALMSGNLNFSL